MAFRVNWTRRALSQLQDAAEYIEKDSPKAAAALIAGAFEATNRLADFPRLGRRVPEWGLDEYRDLILGNYRIIYHIGIGQIEVATFIHGARLLPASPP
jgi:toxin ParE1/3/4